MSDEYSKLRDAAADAWLKEKVSYLDDEMRAKLVAQGKSITHATAIKFADWGYEKGRAEIKDLTRQLADERSGDCDKDKTIRRLQQNSDNGWREVDRLTHELAEAKASQRGAQKHHNELLQLRKAFEKAKDEKFKALEIVERLTAENKRYWNEWSAYAAEVTRLKAELAEANRKIDCFEEALDGTINGWRESLLAKNLAKRQGEPAKCDHERVMTNGCCYFCGVDLSAKPASAASPREWWIYCRAKDEIIVPESAVDESNDSANFYHVIEKSAYDKLREENEELKARAENYQKTMVAQAKTISIYIDEKDALKAECEKLAEALECVIMTEDPKGYQEALTNYAAFKEKMK